jgi:ribose transport system permease protein
MTENSGVTDVPAEHFESSRRPGPDRYAVRSRRLPLSTQVTWWRILGRYGAVFVLVVMILVFVIIEPDTFATSSNFIQILNQSALTAIVSMGLTFVLAAGDFDLSIGYATSFCGVLAAGFIQRDGLAIPVAIALVLAVGAVIGLTNGLIVTRIGVNPLITTLGIGTIVVGVNYAYTGGDPVVINNPTSFIALTFDKLLGLPYPVYVMFVLAILLWIVLNRTVLGQSIQAVGGNVEAARLSGIRVDRIRITAFVIAGVCAGVTGVLLTSLTGSGAVDGGDSYLLSAFAASFFGSAVLRDGQFHIVGTMLGVLTVSVGFNAVAILGLNTYYQYLFQGSLLIFAVGVGTLARRRVAR